MLGTQTPAEACRFGGLLVLARGANLLSFRKERPTQVAAWAGRRSSDRELLSHKGCW